MKLDSNAHPDEIWTAAYLEGTLSAEQVERLERHLARCATCRATVVALHGVEPEQEPVPAELLARAKALPGARSRRGAWIGAGAAAAAAIVVALLVNGLAERRAGAPPPEKYRAAEGGLEALSPGAGSVVTGEDVALRWTAYAGAQRYVVSVTNADGARIATLDAAGDATEISWRVPPDLARPATLFWSVRALRGERTAQETRPTPIELR